MKKFVNADLRLVRPLKAALTFAARRLLDADRPGYRSDDWRDQQRERTLRQSESTRIY